MLKSEGGEGGLAGVFVFEGGHEERMNYEG